MSERERLTMVYEGLNFSSVREFSSRLDLNEDNIANYLSGKSKTIPFIVFERIKKYIPQINSDWLLSGEGEMIKGVRYAKETEVGQGSDVFLANEPQMYYHRGESASLVQFLKEQIKEKDAQIKNFQLMLQDMVSEKSIQKKIDKLVNENTEKPLQYLIDSLDSLQAEVMKKVRTTEETDLVKEIFTKVLQKLLLHQ